MTNTLQETYRRPEPEGAEQPKRGGNVVAQQSRAGEQEAGLQLPGTYPDLHILPGSPHPTSLHPRIESSPMRCTYPGSRLRAGRPSAGTSPPGAGVAAGAGSLRAASPHSPSLLAPAPAMHWRCPVEQAEVPSITAHPLYRKGHGAQGRPEDAGRAGVTPSLAQLTETSLPSEGMKAGRWLSLSLVCRVLKLISSWHFSCTRGGLCKRR